MRSLLMRLEGPMQSWGTQSRFERRDTDAEPSKSGVVGLLAAAQGIQRDADAAIQKLAGLSFAVRVDRPGRVMRDYHTAILGKENISVTQRFYLADASFLAALGSDDGDWLQALAQALQKPVWPLFLGRKAFVPATPVYAGLRDGDPIDVLRQEPLLKLPKEGEQPEVRLVRECGLNEGSPRYDVPISFAPGRRKFACRYVLSEPLGEVKDVSNPSTP